MRVGVVLFKKYVEKSIEWRPVYAQCKLFECCDGNNNGNNNNYYYNNGNTVKVKVKKMCEKIFTKKTIIMSRCKLL